MTTVAIPYSPGYSEAVAAWATYLWTRHRRAVVWYFVLLAADLLITVAGFWDWRTWITGGGLVLTAIVALAPLAFRLLWAYKIRQLDIHELRLTDAGMVVHGTGLQFHSPWNLYDGIFETKRYFFLTRHNGLFSFIPKYSLASADAVDRIREVLQSRIGPGSGRGSAVGEAAV